MYPYEAARNGLVANVPEWAQAGGTEPAKVPAALDSVRQWVEQRL